MYEDNKVFSIAKWAQDAGKRTGMYDFGCNVVFINVSVPFGSRIPLTRVRRISNRDKCPSLS